MVCRTFARRGKSLTPESRIEILDERNALLERREETQEDRALDMISMLLLFGFEAALCERPFVSPFGVA